MDLGIFVSGDFEMFHSLNLGSYFNLSEKRGCGINERSLRMPTWVREPEPVGLDESVQFDIRPGVVPVTLTRVSRQDVCHGQNEAEQPRDYYRSDHLEETMFQWQIILRKDFRERKVRPGPGFFVCFLAVSTPEVS